MTTLAKLIEDQLALKAQLDNFIVNFRKSPKERLESEGHLEGRLEILTKLYTDFSANDRTIQILASEEDKKCDYFTGNLYDNFLELFFEYQGKLKNQLIKISPPPLPPTPITSGAQPSTNKVSPNETDQNENQLGLGLNGRNIEPCQNDVRLPRISIPKFSGDYSSWMSFHDLFKSMVHTNERIPAVQKMHYLKSCLSGEAEKSVRYLNVTEDNYAVAWNCLCQRYQNTKVLVNNTLKILFSQRHVSSENPSDLRNLLDSTKECLATLENLKIKTNEWDPVVIYLLQERLPSETRQLWEQCQGVASSLPHLSELMSFLESRFRTLEAIQPQASKRSGSKFTPAKPHVFHTRRFQCPLCKGSHALRNCIKFGKMNAADRNRVVSSSSLCFNCLAQSHFADTCPSELTCRVCKRRHHTLLHMVDNSKGNSYSKSQDTPPVSEPSGHLQVIPPQVNSYCSRDKKGILLATVLIDTITDSGEPQTLRAIVDPGSEATFITTRAAKTLRLNPIPGSVQIVGIGETITAKAQSTVCFTIKPHFKRTPAIQIQAAVLHKLTEVSPSNRISIRNWTHITGLPLADPTFHTPGKVDVLLGAEVYAKIIEDGVRRGGAGAAVAQKTSFGWILLGEIHSENREILPKGQSSPEVVASFCSQLKEECELLKRFWDMEEVNSCSPPSNDDNLCEQLFADNHSRTPEGRYIVHLPFVPLQEGERRLGDSRGNALKRYMGLEKRLSHDLTLGQNYHQCLEEYLQEGHMEKIPALSSSPDPDKVFYLPHHAIVKADSLTTQTRVVFDASSKSSNGYALNDRLLPGPPLQRDISLLLFEWRQHKFAFTADIARMYRQVLIHPSDRDYQRIIWRRNPREPPEDYRLLTVTFGVSSAPFLAIRSLHQLAKDEGHDLPIGAKILVNDLYVDDVLSGARTLSDAIEARDQIDLILKRGKFELRKWSSNSEEILSGISEERKSSSASVLLNKQNVVKTLGLRWFPHEDFLAYDIKPQFLQPPYTKRLILSEVARIYDPLGWLALVVITPKILLQSLWQRGLDWDEPVPEDLSIQWSRFLQLLRDLKDISIPRFIHTDQNSTLQVHGFCDASERAYGAALYLRSEVNGVVFVHLICAKTKVAPVRSVTLPRLELCGAVLLSKLLKKFLPSVSQRIANVVAWTDSTIVLSWIRRHPNNFKTFVSNRISEIITNIGSVSWRHIPSTENPADLASRGVTSMERVRDKLWWHGPNWLALPETEWPKRFELPEPDPSVLELKPVRTFLTQTHNTELSEILNRYSSIARLLRVTAICKSFAKKCRDKSGNDLSITSLVDEARLFWFRQEQIRYFQEEMNCLSDGNPIPRASKLKDLNPFLDKAGVLRVGGRLQNASLPYNEMHPVILSPDSHLTRLYVVNAHVSCLHGGPTLTLALLRKTVWIINGRRCVSRLIRNCIPCAKITCRPQNQLMGALPAPRVRITRPFTSVGIDYAGPFDLRVSRTRGCRVYKGYVAIFVCLCTKAIHLEAVSDLTTEAFLAALKRFIGRRGLCRDVYSDCGTTFVGARNQLERQIQATFKEATHQAADTYSLHGVQWHFIPPASPHFGGLWEAGVKSMKHHLRRVAGEVRMTYEELSTLLAQIEACLNSRPLCPLSDDVNDLKVLTPGHFLIGDSLLAPPEEDLSSVRFNSLDRWHLVQRLKQDFCRSWTREYLSRLQQRPKWMRVQENVKVGDLVLLKTENRPSYNWPLGRVTQVHPGSDKLTRVVTIKTQTGEYKRPVAKICVLPVESKIKSTYETI